MSTASIGQSLKKAVNSFATDNFTTSGASGLYDRARPSYPVESVAKLLSTLGGKTDAHIVEVGAGTGIFTQCLAKYPSIGESVASIIAIEPSEGMREGFNNIPVLNSVAGKKPQISIVDGSFAEIPAETGSVDIVVGAQCYHWAHPDYACTAVEFARVLKPGGTLAFIWNLEDRKRARWVGQIRDAYEAYEQGMPQYRLGWWRQLFATAEYKDNFEPAQQFDFLTERQTSEQGVVDRVLSKSYITAQSQDTQAQIAENVRKILKDGLDKQWVDESQGIFVYPYETNLVLMRRKA